MRIFKSVYHALRGLRYVWSHEQNFRLECVASAVIIFFAVAVSAPVFHLLILAFALMLVLILECVNTSGEKMLDLLAPRLHEQIKITKDILAAAVLISVIGALAVSFYVLGPSLVLNVFIFK